MKRIASKVAVETVCYTISGLQKIRIVDYKSDWDYFRRENGEVVFEGKERDFIGYKYSKIRRSEVRSISTDGDVIVFSIATVFDEY